MLNAPRTKIGLKRMGELDQKVFVNNCKKRFPLEEAGTKGVELCSLWQENVKNSAWHPFKVVTVDDKAEVCTTLTCFVFIKEFCLNWLVGVVACNFLFTHEGSFIYMLYCPKKMVFIVSN